MKSQHMVYNHPLLNEMVNQYQKSQGLQSWSAAATELIIKGIQGWIDKDASASTWGIDEQQQTALEAEYKIWRREQFILMGYEEEVFPSDEEEEQVAFYRFILDKVSPKQGGKRPGQGRPKGSKNKPK